MADPCLRVASLADLDQLVSMNLELIEDESYDAPLPREKVESRMRDFLAGDFRAFLFEATGDTSGSVVGYALVDTARKPIYLRHFYICREHRRRGFGRIGFQRLCEELSVDCLDVEVMAWNEAARQFWRNLGFVHRYEGLRWKAP